MTIKKNESLNALHRIIPFLRDSNIPIVYYQQIWPSLIPFKTRPPQISYSAHEKVNRAEHETKLIVEGKGEGGLKAILSPKTSQLHTKSLGQSTNFHLSRTDSD